MNELIILVMVIAIVLCLATSLCEEGVESYTEGTGSGVLLFVALLALVLFFGPIAIVYLFFVLLKVVR